MISVKSDKSCYQGFSFLLYMLLQGPTAADQYINCRFSMQPHSVHRHWHATPLPSLHPHHSLCGGMIRITTQTFFSASSGRANLKEIVYCSVCIQQAFFTEETFYDLTAASFYFGKSWEPLWPGSFVGMWVYEMPEICDSPLAVNINSRQLNRFFLYILSQCYLHIRVHRWKSTCWVWTEP